MKAGSKLLLLALLAWLLGGCSSRVAQTPAHAYQEITPQPGTLELTILVLKGTEYQSPGIPTTGVVEFVANGQVQRREIPNGYHQFGTTLFKTIPPIDKLDIKLVEIAGQPVTEDKYTQVIRRISLGTRQYLMILYALPK